MNLKKWLVESSETYRAFGARLGVSRTAVYWWVKGGRRPTIKRCLEIQEQTGGKVRVEDFYPELKGAL